MPKILAGVVLGAILTPALWSHDVWIDEAFTIQTAVAGLREHLRLVYTVYDHPPLYFHLLWIWLRASENIIWLRLLSLLSVWGAGMLLISEVLRRGSNRWLAPLGFAIGFGSATPVLFQSGNLRHYGLSLLFSALYLTELSRELDPPGARGETGKSATWKSVVAGGIGLLSNHFTLFVLAAGELVRCVCQPRALRLRETMRRMLGFFPFLVIWAAIAYAQYPGSGGEAVAAKTGSYSGLGPLLELVERFHGFDSAYDMPAWPGRLSLGCCFVLVGLCLAGLWRNRSHLAASGNSLRPLLLWATVAIFPLVLILLLSIVRPATNSRFLLASGAALWVVYALILGKSRFAGVVLILCAMAGAAGGYWVRAHFSMSAPYGSYSGSIMRAVQPDEALILTAGAHRPLYEYYARRDGVSLPALLSIPSPIIDESLYRKALGELPSFVSGRNRIWVVYEMPGLWEPTLATKKWFERNFRPGPFQELWGRRWVVTYYEPRPAPPGGTPTMLPPVLPPDAPPVAK